MIKEDPLSGGRITQGVVRIGNNVHRPQSANPAFVHTLLTHLEGVGLPGIPRFCGIDTQNREILTFMEGWVPDNLRPDWTDVQLQQAARLIRALHNATTGTSLAGDEEVVCHNDLSPCNFVISGEMPVGLIDFDAAAPGSRLADLAYAIWMWLDLGGETGVEEQGRRMKLMCDAYGLEDRSKLLAIIDQSQKKTLDSMRAINDAEAAKWIKQENEWLKKNQIQLQQVLT